MSTKFNIYYSTNPTGPWTLSNPSPIDRVEGLQSYTITGLKPNTEYYLSIVGGTLDDGEFVPLVSQAIGPRNTGAAGVGAPESDIFRVKTFAPKITTDSILFNQFEVV